MKILAAAGAVIILAALLWAAFAAGRASGRRYSIQQWLDTNRLTANMPKLLGQAYDVLGRLLEPPRDLTGEFNMLTYQTRADVIDVRNAIKKEIGS